MGCRRRVMIAVVQCAKPVMQFSVFVGQRQLYLRLAVRLPVDWFVYNEKVYNTDKVRGCMKESDFMAT